MKLVAHQNVVIVKPANRAKVVTAAAVVVVQSIKKGRSVNAIKIRLVRPKLRNNLTLSALPLVPFEA